MPRRRDGARRPERRLENPAPCSAPNIPAARDPAVGRAQLSTATCSSSAAAPPARPSPRCSPSRAATWSLLEKAHHPRFHIGESLLPANVALFDRLGVREEVERIGMPKYGVEFVSPDHEHRQFIEFAEAWDKSMPYAWQVRRSELDELLFRNAAAKGARTLRRLPRARGRASTPTAPRSQVELDDGAQRSWRARFVVDASGRDTLLANQFALQGEEPAATTARRCSATSPAPSGCRASSKATSPSSGSSTAGSGSSRWPTARPASARSAGRTT